MNRKAVIVGVVSGMLCFAMGLLTGRFLFQKNRLEQLSDSVAPGGQSRSSSSALEASLSSATGSAKAATGAGTLTEPSEPKRSTTIADLQAALGGTRVGYGIYQDFRKIYKIIDGLDANQFAAAIAACLKSGNWATRGVAIQEIGARWG